MMQGLIETIRTAQAGRDFQQDRKRSTEIARGMCRVALSRWYAGRPLMGDFDAQVVEMAAWVEEWNQATGDETDDSEMLYIVIL